VTELSNRRPLKSRGTGWARGLAAGLARRRVSPDTVSLLGLAFALFGAAALAMSSQAFGPLRPVLFVVAAIAIQLRLLCNLLDGLVAVEHGRGGPCGPIWNELPDRFSDIALLLGAGVAASPAGVEFGLALGGACALLAVLTAYVRELGRGLGLPADFSGPMAKPHRMALLTAAAALSAFEGLWHGRGQVMTWAMAAMALLLVVTVWRRTARLARGLRARATD
jgi:phosphatidylglycerophosphate synthase